MLADQWVFEESPCELCPHAARCRQGLACAAFESFARYGGRRWRSQARSPSRELFAKIFKSDRAIAAEIGVGSNTVRRARHKTTAPGGAVEAVPTDAPAPVEKRVGRDGKAWRSLLDNHAG